MTEVDADLVYMIRFLETTAPGWAAAGYGVAIVAFAFATTWIRYQ
tara:strand:- start:254 stop:388 length:135 start_codon:yes stop_codon:yes gene_type:complete